MMVATPNRSTMAIMMRRITILCTVGFIWTVALPAAAQQARITPDDWVALLQHGTPEEKIRAARMLADLQAIETIPALGAALDDPEPKVRFYVIRALGSLRDPGVEPYWGKALRDPVGENRREAYKFMMAYYLGVPVPPTWKQILPGFYREPRQERLPWKTVHASVVEALRQWLRADDDTWIALAVNAAGRLWIHALVPDLVHLLQTAQAKRVVMNVFRTLGRLHACTALQSLQHWLNSPDIEILERVVWAVAQCAGTWPAVGDRLFAEYNRTRDARRRFVFFQGLAYTGYAPAASLFVRGLTSDDARTRMVAAEGLGRIGDPQYQEDLGRAFLQETDPGARLAMDFALFLLGRREHAVDFIRVLQEENDDRYWQLAGYVAEAGERIIPEMFRYFDRLERKVQLRVLQLASHTDATDVIPLLERYLNSPDEEIVVAAFESIKIIRQAHRLRQAGQAAPPATPSGATDAPH